MFISCIKDIPDFSQISWSQKEPLYTSIYSKYGCGQNLHQYVKSDTAREYYRDTFNKILEYDNNFVEQLAEATQDLDSCPLVIISASDNEILFI